MSYSKLALLGGAGLTLLSFGGVFSDTLELLSHWRIQILALSIVLAALVSIRGDRRIQAAAVGLCILNAWPVAQHMERTAPRAVEASSGGLAGGEALTVLTANLFSGRVDRDALEELLRDSTPDIALFTEVSPDSETLIRDSLPDHGFAWIGEPHRLFSSFIALRGLEPSPVVTFATAEALFPWGHLEACFHRCLTIIALHAAPPPGLADLPKRDIQLQQIADFVAATSKPDLLLGDLNLSPWAPGFTALSRNTGLKDSAPDLELGNTWPMTTPGLGIRIDHILVGEDFEVADYRIGPDLASDHRPVIARILGSPQ